MTIWQIAAGDGPERDYADIFLKYGLAAVGPGTPGPYAENRSSYAKNSPHHRPFLEPFCERLNTDDLLILKRPEGRDWSIIAVGQVQGPYRWEPLLADVEGWDLQHSRRVRWRHLRPARKVFGLRRGTLSRVNKPELRELAEELWNDGDGELVARQPLPEPPKAVDDEQIIRLLIGHGISSTAAETTASTLRRLRRLADWYADIGEEIGEHEIRTFVVVPLLLALGWPEQRMRIEYQRADIALWNVPFSNPHAAIERIVETKRVYNALGRNSIDQAAGYADAQPHCHSIIVTDGFRWKLFDRGEDEDGLTPWHPTAYANLLEMRDRHPLEEQIGGAGELFLSLLP